MQPQLRFAIFARRIAAAILHVREVRPLEGGEQTARLLGRAVALERIALQATVQADDGLSVAPGDVESAENFDSVSDSRSTKTPMVSSKRIPALSR